MRPDANTIEYQETGSKGRYALAAPGGAVAEMTTSKAGAGLVIIDHTGVPDELRGKGYGQVLVERAVADARAAGTKILPLCPFAAALFRRHADWTDVLNSAKGGGS